MKSRFLFVGIALCFSVVAQVRIASAEPTVTAINPEHEKFILEMFAEGKWDPDKLKANKIVGAPTVRPPNDLDVFWKGNEPTIDVSVERVELIYSQQLEDRSRHLFHLNVDLSKKEELFFHSETTLKKFRGGAILESSSPKDLRRFYFPGQNSSGVFIFAPPMKKNQDFYFLACPREIVTQSEGVVALKNTNVQLYSALVIPQGSVKAFLLSGLSSGNIEASIDRTAVIPPGMEPYDLVQGSNPVLDLSYRADPNYVAPPMSEEVGENHQFMVTIEMQLPAGYKRRILEGYDVLVKTVQMPLMRAVVPISTVIHTAAKSAITSRVQIDRGKEGLSANIEPGPCSLVVVEKRVRQVTLFDK